MSLTNTQLLNLGKLAALEIHTEELTQLTAEVNAILDFVSHLQQLNTHGVAPLFHPLEKIQPLRDDEVTEADCLQQLKDIAEQFEDNFYWVPKVLNDD